MLILLPFIDFQIKLKMIFCLFLITLDQPWKGCQKKSILVAMCNFNAKLRECYSLYANKFEGISVENVASQFRLYQIIKEPTYVLENSSSCIDLLLTFQPN